MNNIVFKLNNNDNYNLNQDCKIVDFTKKDDYHLTFFNSLRSIYKFPNFFSVEALDLFYISLMVYYADRVISRQGTYDNWTRSFKIYAPVLSLSKWQNNKELLEKIISFLSGDKWKFEFRERGLTEIESKIQSKIPNSYKDRKFNFSSFCMLSGGLDSFIGAIDLLEVDRDVAFVGHYGGGKGVKPYQESVNSILMNSYEISASQFFNFYAAPLKGIEDTTRSRSFMFFTHAILLASTFNHEMKLVIPENGLISLNIPLTNTRLGSSSTRTTHPFYMKLFQQLISNLGLNIRMENPYQFDTKGEMIKNCTNPSLIKEFYTKTMSCSHPDNVRYLGEIKPMHCGTCLPCTIRRASIEYAYTKDTTDYFDLYFSQGRAINELHSFKIGIMEYQKRKSQNFIIQLSGKIEDELDRYVATYERGMNEFMNLINKIN